MAENMTLYEAMQNRHSVRSYKDIPIEKDAKEKLQSFINECNAQSNLNIQLLTDEPDAFDNFLAHYGSFKGVRNYIAITGKSGKQYEEKCGYYGEKIVLFAQSLGLNTCWVAMSYSKGKAKQKFKINKGEKLHIVISIGYGENQGVAHKSKPAEKVMNTAGEVPQWFLNGVNASLTAPTAINQQKFVFSLNGTKVSAKAGIGFYTNIDLGIAKYHFELGAGKENFTWENPI